MRLIIMSLKFVFTIIFFSQLSTGWSTHRANKIYDGTEFPSYMDDSLQLLRHLCEDDMIFLNFSNAVISNINRDFISSPLITCLALADSHIEKIERDAFNKLPNLTQLFLSNNRLYDLFNFGGHNKLNVLVMNSAVIGYNYAEVKIYDEYPNLEILSLRKNNIRNLEILSLRKDDVHNLEFKFSFPAYPRTTVITQKILFPKLKALDLSENKMEISNFVELLPNSLYFLDLHDNLLYFLNLSNRTNKLFALNLDNNRFNSIKNWDRDYSLSVVGLKDLQYLSVSTNKINIIDSDAFVDNDKLLYINLSTNHIKNLHSKTFANLQYLKTLDLSFNQLEDVPQMSNEIEINTLYINYNNITELISHTFVQMPKLTKLLLAGNRINKINVNAFAHLSVLEKLDLSKNMLSSLPNGWAESLVSLKYLDLSDNKFTSLEFLSLTKALPVIEIYLTMNPLEHLNVKYFENLPLNLTINLINICKIDNKNCKKLVNYEEF
ncbi:PREDICTED: leucine-rich repeat-containing protein let-4-like [Wasmannia auropunctata]|uniref:leucine-rich repeat-containing protein let-4-like n=1 Tax=Wasmannia auropunctata TaxID=64793 RepID=UPI0005EDB85B|nr:PREDICTED: leucine-rich repeat-containing protein let-4-like [Wasmannia auropunctata]